MGNKFLSIIIFFITFACSSYAMASDPWSTLQERYKSEHLSIPQDKKSSEDPWAKLRDLYLPFTEEEEISAFTTPEKAYKVSRYLYEKLLPYKDEIESASKEFNIPKEIIGALIIVESGGNYRAKARTSSAKGLTQTINSTFREARNALHSRGLNIKNNPFDPNSSIMAGSWYLDRMFKKALDDNKSYIRDRKNLSAWRFPLEYYYVGPGNGVKEEDIVIIYSGGQRLVLNKAAYAQKVISYAKLLDDRF